MSVYPVWKSGSYASRLPLSTFWNDYFPGTPLIDITKSYVEHEHKVLSDIADARARMAGATKREAPTDEKVQVADELMGAVSRLLVVIEKYPDLKANDQFQHLRQRLVETEDRITSARSYYNEQVLSYNKTVRSWPTSAIAKREGLKSHAYFGSAPAETLKGSEDMGKMDSD